MDVESYTHVIGSRLMAQCHSTFPGSSLLVIVMITGHNRQRRLDWGKWQCDDTELLGRQQVLRSAQGRSNAVHVSVQSATSGDR